MLRFSRSMGLRPKELKGRRGKGGNGRQKKRPQAESIVSHQKFLIS